MSNKSIVVKIGKKITPNSLRPVARRAYIKIRHFFKYGTTDFFDNVAFETITACTRRCVYCPNSIYDRGLISNKKLMDECVFKKIVRELVEMKFSREINMHLYGEPLLDERLVDWAAHVRRNLPKVNIHIFSNGDLMNLEIYKKLIAAGVDLFVISQHGETMSPNIREMLKNFHEVEYKDNFLHDAAYALNGEKRATILYRDIKKNTTLDNRGGLLKDIKPNMDNLKCRMPNNFLPIDYEGNVILCCNDYFSTIKFGNIKNESILDIWNKENFKKIRKDLRDGILRLDICKKCRGIF